MADNIRSVIHQIEAEGYSSLRDIAEQLNRRGVKTARGGEAGDFQTALKEWKPLADQGHAGAQYNLGLMYADGRGVPEDDAEAAGWLRLAASGPQYQR